MISTYWTRRGSQNFAMAPFVWMNTTKNEKNEDFEKFSCFVLYHWIDIYKETKFITIFYLLNVYRLHYKSFSLFLYVLLLNYLNKTRNFVIFRQGIRRLRWYNSWKFSFKYIIHWVQWLIYFINWVFVSYQTTKLYNLWNNKNLNDEIYDSTDLFWPPFRGMQILFIAFFSDLLFIIYSYILIIWLQYVSLLTL